MYYVFFLNWRLNKIITYRTKQHWQKFYKTIKRFNTLVFNLLSICFSWIILPTDGFEMMTRRGFGLSIKPSINWKIKHKWTEYIILDFIILDMIDPDEKIGCIWDNSNICQSSTAQVILYCSKKNLHIIYFIEK